MKNLLAFASDEELFGEDPPFPPEPKPPNLSSIAVLAGPPRLFSSDLSSALADKPVVNLVVASASSQKAVDAQPGVTRRTGPAIAEGDAELDLKHDLRELNNIYLPNRAAMEEKLFELHKVMAGHGREGHFTAFVRDELDWGDRAYGKAMRWIAAHKLRAGIFTRQQYDQAMGNGGKSNTSRIASMTASNGAMPALPPLHQTFSEDEDGAALAVVPIAFTEEEIAGDQKSVTDKERSFLKPTFVRYTFSAGEHLYFTYALQEQKRRYGVKTDAEAIFKVLLCGRKRADKDKEWAEMDEEFMRIGMNPLLALEPEYQVDDEFDQAAEDDEQQHLRDEQEERQEAAEARRARLFLPSVPADSGPTDLHILSQSDGAEEVGAQHAPNPPGSTNYLVEDFADLVVDN